MKRLDAYPTYLVSEGASALFLSVIFTVDLVYQVEIAHLNPLQLVLVGTVLEATVFVLEIPTGIVADMYSRRRSIVIGTILVGFGFILEGSIPRWETILVAQVLWGAGYTFTSGAMEAWISDEIGEPKAGKAFLRASQVSHVGDLVGIPISIALASLSLQVPIVLGGLLISTLGLFLLACMPERGFAPMPLAKWRTQEHIADTFQRGLSMIRRRPVLLTILMALAVYGAFSEGFDRLWTPHLLTNFTLPALGVFEPVAWFGLIRAAGVLLAVAATEFARRRVDYTSHVSIARASMVISGLLVVCVVAFGAATDFVIAFMALLAIQPLRRVLGPIQTAWVNQGLDSQVRATVISMSAQADAFGQMIGGPMLGAIATLATTRFEMIVAGLALAPVFWLYANSIGQKHVLAQPLLKLEK